MSYENNIHNFTARDIEKYHKGLLSPKERHALEKAALDDPFLADALEGYAAVNTNIAADIEELKRRLAQGSEKTKVIPMYASSKSSFPWLRVAVLVILIAGASLLSYQFLFKSESNNVAVAEPKKEDTARTKESPTLSPQSNQADTVNNNITKPEEVKKTNSGTITVTKIGSTNGSEGDLNVTADSAKQGYAFQNTNPPIATKEAGKKEEETRDLAETKLKTDTIANFNNSVVGSAQDRERRSDKSHKAVAADDFKDTQVTAKGEVGQTRQKVAAPANQQGALNYSKSNIFRGIVRDANNNPLPFANITNTRDNVGTYTDAQGSFTLISPADSVLNVQVKVVGFENTNATLRNLAGDNQIMMREDRSLTAKILDTVKRDYAQRSREATMTFEEPEPTAGWEYYGSYLVNNLNVPDNFVMKNSEESNQSVVEVSFEVNKNGDPINIRVEKSLCEKCDKEAIRLIKEGPKFKGRTKKGKRTTVKVPFIKPE